MHAAALTSPRLQRVLVVLKDGRPHTTRSLIRMAHVCSVSSIIAELRCHGAEIDCSKQKYGDEWRFFYTMTKSPEGK